MPFRARFPVVAAAVLTATLVLSACSSTDTAGAIAVKAGNHSCDVATTTLAAGSSSFEVTNDGDDVTEVYVYARGDEVKGELENIGPGTSRTFSVDLTAGKYEVACKPGMKGDGIRTKITVTGKGGKSVPVPDRTADVTAIDYEYQGLDALHGTTGETVELRLHNDAPGEKHEMEVFGPDGKAFGEVGPTKPGRTGRVVLTFADAGTYKVRCGIDDHAQKGMNGAFTVG
ncbi:MAG: cupredoxin domain-containing protein [Acidimicrobiia bacterium]